MTRRLTAPAHAGAHAVRCRPCRAWRRRPPAMSRSPRPDGVALKGTYFAAARPGPAVLLLHMCNTDRHSWDPLATELAEAGISALTVDYRGFGESGGPRFDTLGAVAAQQMVNGAWPGDVDKAYEFLLAQPGVDKARIGVGGGSCGVTQALLAAKRHPEVRSLVLLAGPANRDARRFLMENNWLPVFAAAADDDQFDRDAPQQMRWLTELSGNARNKFMGFADGKHGTEIFKPHPELPKAITDWYLDTLVAHVANPRAKMAPVETPAREFWESRGRRESAAGHRPCEGEPSARSEGVSLSRGRAEPCRLRGAPGQAHEGRGRAVHAECRDASDLGQRSGQPRRRVPGGWRPRTRARGVRKGAVVAGRRSDRRAVQAGDPRKRRAEDREASSGQIEPVRAPCHRRGIAWCRTDSTVRLVQADVDGAAHRLGRLARARIRAQSCSSATRSPRAGNRICLPCSPA